MSLRAQVTIAASSLLAVLVACGTPSNLDDFNTGAGQDGGSEAGNSLAVTSKPDAGLAACATQTATADPRPVYLVVMFDKSGSMDDNGKWPASKAAAKAFFNAPDSKGMSASLSFFPNKNDSCNVSDYSTPRVPMAALPSPDFGTQLDGQSPNGGTPTYQAMQGAISYAQSIATGQGKDGTVAIVLITDGLPAGCNNNSVNKVASLVGTVATTIPTYVIGVGSALSNLNEIAASGGTTNAFVVSENDPAQTQADFTKAINEIRASTLTCDYKIPPAPAGAALDRSKVNVQHTPTGAAPATLGYNQACAGGTGWKYDDATNPTRILLCDTTCNGIKAMSGKVDILFGCETQSGPVK